MRLVSRTCDVCGTPAAEPEPVVSSRHYSMAEEKELPGWLSVHARTVRESPQPEEPPYSIPMPSRTVLEMTRAINPSAVDAVSRAVEEDNAEIEDFSERQREHNARTRPPFRPFNIEGGCDICPTCATSRPAEAFAALMASIERTYQTAMAGPPSPFGIYPR